MYGRLAVKKRGVRPDFFVLRCSKFPALRVCEVFPRFLSLSRRSGRGSETLSGYLPELDVVVVVVDAERQHRGLDGRGFRPWLDQILGIVVGLVSNIRSATASR